MTDPRIGQHTRFTVRQFPNRIFTISIHADQHLFRNTAYSIRTRCQCVHGFFPGAPGASARCSRPPRIIPAMQPCHELFDHTADMGVRVRAATMPELIAPATEGFYTTIGEIVGTAETSSFAFDSGGSDSAVLLRDYLNELLILFERDRRRVGSFEHIAFSDERLVIAARSSPVDVDRSSYLREVKAITYHELSIRAIAGGYEATFIVDI